MTDPDRLDHQGKTKDDKDSKARCGWDAEEERTYTGEPKIQSRTELVISGQCYVKLEDHEKALNDLHERIKKLKWYRRSFNDLMVLVGTMVEPGVFKDREGLLQNFDVWAVWEGHHFTGAEIDAAWKYVMDSESPTPKLYGLELLKEFFGIKRCEGCDGSGFTKRPATGSPGDDAQCGYCHGHCWVIGGENASHG